MKDTKTIKVLNYIGSPVVLSGINRSYTIGAGSTDRPASILMPFDDVDHINSNTDVFRNGILMFPKEDFDAVHEMLGNVNIKDTCFDENRIQDIILNPTYDKAMTVCSINSIAIMERFRSTLLRIKSIGSYPVSPNIERVITERYKEVNHGVRNSRIVIHNDSFKYVTANTSDLEDKLKKLTEKIEAMESSAVKNADGAENEDAGADKVKAEPKKSTRQPKPKE